jgi:hypothetical protein
MYSEKQSVPSTDKEQVLDDRFTSRAVLLGAFFVVVVSVWATYSEFIVRSSRLNMSNFPLALFVPFVLFALVVNPVLKARRSRWAFGRSDLLVALAMGLTSAVIPAADGLPGYLLGIIAAPFYFATPENGWTPYLHDHIQPWMAPSNDRQAMTWFFEGLPPGQTVPWGEWVVPLFWWLSFIGAAACVSICLAVLLRRQWVDHERLVYPLATVAADLVSAPKSGVRMVGGTLFWSGFASGFGMIAWNILSYFFPGAPKFPTGSYQSGISLPLGRSFPGVRIKFNLFTIGFVYFANLEVLFSVWFFYVLNVFQVGILNRLGFGLKNSDSWGSSYEVAGWEGFGGLTVFVGWGLWTARAHFQTVFRSAFKRVRHVGEGAELMGYRVAVWGVLLGVSYLVLWLHTAGMAYGAAILCILATLVTYVGVAKIVAETGLIYVRTPLSGQAFTLAALGTVTLSGATMTALAMSYALVSYRGLFMPGLVHGTRLADFVRGNRRVLLGAVVFGLILSAVVSIALALYLAYGHGAYHFDVWPYRSGNKAAFNAAVAKMKAPQGPDSTRLMLFGIGALLMGLLSFLRYRFPGWSLHPVGLTIAGTNFTRELAFSAFLVWAIKGLFLKAGGMMLYRRWQPFFVGLLIGYALAVTLSFIVDLVWFPGQGHVVHVF